MDPDYEEEDGPKGKEEEEKQSSGGEKSAKTEASKQVVKRTEYAVDSDENMEDEERRVMATARQLNKAREARSKSKAKKR